MDTQQVYNDKIVSDAKCRPKLIPLETLINYGEKGLNYTEIAKLVGCSKQAVANRFNKVQYVPQQLKQFRDSKAEIYEFMQSQLVNTLSQSDLKRMAPDRRIWSIAVLEDKIRLIRGQSTENVSIAGTLNSIDSRIQELRKKLPPSKP